MLAEARDKTRRAGSVTMVLERTLALDLLRDGLSHQATHGSAMVAGLAAGDDNLE